MNNPKKFEIPVHLQSDLVHLKLLEENDFEKLYTVASDPLIWEQHPNKDRYKRDVFENYFRGAMESKGAYLVTDIVTGDVIGCSRFYDYNADENTVFIGYTFLARSCWGKPYNRSLKTVMLNHAFQFTDTVIFHVGKNNIRSQKAMEKLGAIKTAEVTMSYYGEVPHLNVVYHIPKKTWMAQQPSR